LLLWSLLCVSFFIPLLNFLQEGGVFIFLV
jgi:hypothetical protein